MDGAERREGRVQQYRRDATRRRINERDRVTDAGTSDALSAPRTPLRPILYIVQISISSSRKSQCILMRRAVPPAVPLFIPRSDSQGLN